MPPSLHPADEALTQPKRFSVARQQICAAHAGALVALVAVFVTRVASTEISGPAPIGVLLATCAAAITAFVFRVRSEEDRSRAAETPLLSNAAGSADHR